MKQLDLDPLHTDYYQITMGYTYFKANQHNNQSTFEAFYRTTPFKGQYVIAAGIQDAIEYIQNYKFTDENIEFIKEILPEDADPKFFEYLKELNGSLIQVQAVKEGELIFPYFPMIILKGPLCLIQMLETAITNFLSFPSLIATNASRFRQIVGKDKQLLEFGLRRAQGPNGGLSASKYSYLGGFDGTSNVKCSQTYKIFLTGTMAHSLVTSYENLNEIEDHILNNINVKQQSLNYLQIMNVQTHQGELAAFIQFAISFKQKFLCLIDTYNTLSSGIYNYLAVASVLMDCGYEPLGIRLDSGDLAYYSIQCKNIFNNMGQLLNKDFSKFKVVASDDINEEKLKTLKLNNHQIDSFGIGTNLVTCQKQPALGLVYKLIKNNQKYVVKLSVGKKVYPGEKAIYRVKNEQGEVKFDLMCLEEEDIQNYQQLNVRNMKDTNQKYIVEKFQIEKILHEVYNQKQLIFSSLNESKEYCKQRLESFDQTVLQIENPMEYQVMMTEKYYNFNEKIIDANNISVKLF